MSEKRGAAGSSSDEQTNEDSDALSQRVNNSKHSTRSSLSEVTLEDLPIEMVECILLRAVAMEVKEMKLAKSVWTEKADIVIRRLRTVCSHWNNILRTNFFRNEVNRILDGTAEEKVRLEVLHQLPIELRVLKIATLKDDIFLLCWSNDCDWKNDTVINVCEHNNTSIELTDVVIPLGEITINCSMAACSVSNCLYVLIQEKSADSGLVIRITKDEGHSFSALAWIPDLKSLSVPVFCVGSNGSLVITSYQEEPNQNSVTASKTRPTERLAVDIYNANGFLQQKIKLCEDIHELGWISDVMLKPNGNLLLISYQRGTQVSEIDMRGCRVRHYESQHILEYEAIFTDICGRIYLNDWEHTVEVLDAEFNLFGFSCPQLGLLHDGVAFPLSLHYNRERNEVVRVSDSARNKSRTLTIFRLTEK